MAILACCAVSSPRWSLPVASSPLLGKGNLHQLFVGSPPTKRAFASQLVIHVSLSRGMCPAYPPRKKDPNLLNVMILVSQTNLKQIPDKTHTHTHAQRHTHTHTLPLKKHTHTHRNTLCLHHVPPLPRGTPQTPNRGVSASGFTCARGPSTSAPCPAPRAREPRGARFRGRFRRHS